MIGCRPSRVAVQHVVARRSFTLSRSRPLAAPRAIRCAADPSSCTYQGRRGAVSGRRTALLGFAGIGMTLVCGNGTLALPAAAAALSRYGSHRVPGPSALKILKAHVAMTPR